MGKRQVRFPLVRLPKMLLRGICSRKGILPGSLSEKSVRHFIQIVFAVAGEKVRSIHIDRKGNRWFCSEYDGVAVFGKDGQRIRLLTKQDGLPDNEMKQMAEDKEGNLWFACRRGVLCINAQAAGTGAKP